MHPIFFMVCPQKTKLATLLLLSQPEQKKVFILTLMFCFCDMYNSISEKQCWNFLIALVGTIREAPLQNTPIIYCKLLRKWYNLINLSQKKLVCDRGSSDRGTSRQLFGLDEFAGWGIFGTGAIAF
jgi:hypothetical protein